MHPSQVDEIKKWLITPTGLFACGSTITALSATALVLVNKLRAPRGGVPPRHSVRHSVEELSREDPNEADARIAATIADLWKGESPTYMDRKAIDRVVDIVSAKIDSEDSVLARIESVDSSAVVPLGASRALGDEYFRAAIACACVDALKSKNPGLVSKETERKVERIKARVGHKSTARRASVLLGQQLAKIMPAQQPTDNSSELVVSKRLLMSSFKTAISTMAVSAFAGLIYSASTGGHNMVLV
jgi:hypothetical protein